MRPIAESNYWNKIIEDLKQTIPPVQTEIQEELKTCEPRKRRI